MRTELGGDELRVGEFFLTRHSTLRGAHVVFHFVSDNSELPADSAKSPLVCGLRNMLALASEYDVTSLTLPVLLADRGAETMMSDSVMIKRAQTILFAVKSSLQQHCATDNPLKNIRFVAPRCVRRRRRCVLARLTALSSNASQALLKRFRELL